MERVEYHKKDQKMKDGSALQKALKESEEKYQLVAENALVGIYQLDIAGKFIFVNKAFAKMVGYKQKELIDQHFSLVLPASLIEKGKKVFQTIVSDDKNSSKFGPQRVKESYLHNKKGHDLFVQYSFNFPLKAKKKGYLSKIALTGMAVDITENKKLENELMAHTKALENLKTTVEHEKVQVESILNSIGDGVVATDTYGRVIMLNKTAEKMLGWTSEELFGKLLMDTVPLLDGEKGEPLPREQHPISIILATGQNFATYINNSDQYYFYVSRSGRKFPVSITASPVRLNKTIIGAIKTFRDITKNREVDKAKSEFVSLASHQLRTPLTIIGLYSEMLASQDGQGLSGQQKKYLDEIVGANKRMIKLVDMILNVSRIDLGVLNVVSMPVNFREIAEVICHQYLPQIKEKQLQFKQNYNKDLPIFNSDPKLVEIILDNLVSNALKYTPPKGKIDLSITENNHHGILIKVTDSGYGIPEAQQDKVFSKMFRADNVLTNDTEGTGLGLYIIKSFVEKMGGKVWFESQENKGTTFYVNLPSVQEIYQNKLTTQHR